MKETAGPGRFRGMNSSRARNAIFIPAPAGSALARRAPGFPEFLCRLRAAVIRAGIGLVALALAGLATRWIVPPLAIELSHGRGRPAITAITEREGESSLLGAVDKVRALVGDIQWLRAHVRWEARDAAGTETGLRRAVAANPGSLGFWLNGARVLAYDIPEWRIARLGSGLRGCADGAKIDAEQAGQALAWLDEAVTFHGAAPEIFVERALIQLYRLHDPAAAADSFRQAAERPGAPDYAVRLQAALLHRLKRDPWVHDWPAEMPRKETIAGDAAGAEWVLACICSLELELGTDSAR